jgi:ABC-type dipeptide/oligopeptide/nickel transport system permease subunit
MALAPTEFLPTESSVAALPRTRGFGHRLASHRLAQIGGFLIILLLLVAFLAPLLSPHVPTETLKNGLGPLGEPHPPGEGFLFGADTLGRDVWTRTLWGTRVSLLVGIFAMTTAVLIGTTIGLISGYFGGWVDAVLMRFTEIVMSLPTILLALALRAVLPDQPEKLPALLSYGWRAFSAILPEQLAQLPLFNMLIAIALVTWTGIARAVRGQVLSLKEREFIEAARAIGCSHGRILFVHLLPNVLPTVIVLATLATAHNILLEAGLSFLGLGVDPSIPSWGSMIAEGQPYILSAPWIILAPGIAVASAVTAFNLLGTAMQETLEPRAR